VDILEDGQVGYIQISDFFRSEEDTLALRRFLDVLVEQSVDDILAYLAKQGTARRVANPTI